MEGKIEFILKKSDKKLTFKILNQVGFNGGDIVDIYKGFNIKCEKFLHPYISVKNNLFEKEIRISLRGEYKTMDNTPCHVYFKSNDERDEIYEIIISFFEKLSMNKSNHF